MNQCPICNKDIVSPIGNPKSEILLVGGEPDEEELQIGMPFVNRAGNVLKAELFRNKVDYKRLRITYFWLHVPMKAVFAKKVDKAFAADLNAKCQAYFLEQLLKETEGKKAILLIGADAVKPLTGKNVSEWAGLKMGASDYLDSPLIMCMPKPSQVNSSPLGEVRLSLYKFSKVIRKENHYE